NLNYYNNKIYIIGGIRLSTNREFYYLDDKIEVFDLKTQTIIIDNTNPHQATNFASFIYDNNIIVMGGSVKLKNNGKKLFTNKSHIYNLESGYWYQLKDMSEAKEVKGVLIKNKIYLIGGFNIKPLKEIESYNLTTGKWEREGELFSPIAIPALAYHNNFIYIYNNKKICTYNIETKELTEYLIDLPFKSSELYYFDDKLYILGGYFENEYSKTPSRNLYSIHLSEFKKTAINKSKTLVLIKQNH
ncbi:MAG: galactose oxidase, partial [Chlorobi bacterium]|nr:galactose oxidase [Chlorobiota bacterium]